MEDRLEEKCVQFGHSTPRHRDQRRLAFMFIRCTVAYFRFVLNVISIFMEEVRTGTKLWVSYTVLRCRSAQMDQFRPTVFNVHYRKNLLFSEKSSKVQHVA
jgi:hypothetical protein